MQLSRLSQPGPAFSRLLLLDWAMATKDGHAVLGERRWARERPFVDTMPT